MLLIEEETLRIKKPNPYWLIRFLGYMEYLNFVKGIMLFGSKLSYKRSEHDF